jgi:hypothetical protein
LDAATVEVELNRANLLSQFDVRNIRNNFIQSIEAAATEEDILAIVDSVSNDIAEFTTALDEQIEAALDIARQNENLEERLPEAEEYG